MAISQKDLLNISGGVLAAFETHHYLSELSHSKAFKHRAKLNLKRTLEDLKDIEITYFDEVEKVDEKDMQSKKIDNRLDFTKWMLTRFNSIDVEKLKEVCVAFYLDPNRITSISDKIHLKNGSKKV